MKEIGFNKPSLILLAQLHPVSFFGFDLFQQLYSFLLSRNVIHKFPETFSFVAIDEIQVCVESRSVHNMPGSTNSRPFFSPLVHFTNRLQRFPHFLLSGTGINFEYIKELMEFKTMKNDQLSYKVLSNFHPLSKDSVEIYTTQFLQGHQVVEVRDVVSRISSFELCHGRPRFLTFILEDFLNSKDINVSIAKFVSGITSVDDLNFPLRFFKRDLENNKFSLNRIISSSTLGDTIRDGMLSLVLRGKLMLSVTDEDGAAAICYGLGFGDVIDGKLHKIEINELAVIECLRFFVPFSSLVLKFAKQMSVCPQPHMIGYMLEYLVAFALVANFAGDDDVLRRINVSQKASHEYLRIANASQVCFPDHICGPDIIYKCIKTKTVYIVQVKFVNRLTKQEIANACSTTDPNKFYCKRNLKEGETGSFILEKFTKKRNELLKALVEVQNEGYSLQQLLFIHSGGNTIDYAHGATIINSRNSPKFFDKIGSGVWQFLDSLREKFQ